MSQELVELPLHLRLLLTLVGEGVGMHLHKDVLDTLQDMTELGIYFMVDQGNLLTEFSELHYLTI